MVILCLSPCVLGTWKEDNGIAADREDLPKVSTTNSLITHLSPLCATAC